MREGYSIQIISGTTGQPVDAEIFDQIEAKNLRDFQTRWRPMLLEREFDLLTNPHSTLPSAEDRLWNWAAKLERTANNLSYRHFALECRGITQGLMQIELTHRSRVNNEHLVYIDFLTVAPWNRKNFVDVPIFKAVGTILFAQAVGTSIDEGFKGRIGLHSLPGASAFYRKKSMTSFGVDENYENLEYFEFDEESAAAFMASLN